MIWLNHPDVNWWDIFWALFYPVVAYTVVHALLSILDVFKLLRIDYWGDNIELMSSDESSFRLIYVSVCFAGKEGTCTGA